MWLSCRWLRTGLRVLLLERLWGCLHQAMQDTQLTGLYFFNGASKFNGRCRVLLLWHTALGHVNGCHTCVFGTSLVGLQHAEEGLHLAKDSLDLSRLMPLSCLCLHRLLSRGVSCPKGGTASLGLPLNTIRQIWGKGTRAGLYPLNEKEVCLCVCVCKMRSLMHNNANTERQDG
jgi:hypothetical protein